MELYPDARWTEHKIQICTGGGFRYTVDLGTTTNVVKFDVQLWFLDSTDYKVFDRKVAWYASS